ncbi:MAG: class II fructose-bisphosphate aldolase [Candidatus Pacebacteria bacterium]|nr:class II fructose-bisphosphate aldolase [Candidatus Paceibacterota bacterium]
MFSLAEEIKKAQENNTAIGHFNISNLEMLKGVILATQELSIDEKVPVIIGLSENERKYIGDNQIMAFIKSLREETNHPIFINADHCKSYESAEKAVHAGYDSIVVDNSKLPFLENIKATKKTTSILKNINPEIIIEGELGFIGESSTLLDKIPSEVEITEESITKVIDAKKFVDETEVDMISPAVGNMHGILKNFLNPNLHIKRIKEISEEVKIPLVLHGGSGTATEEISEAIKSGIAIIHFSTDLRIAFKNGLTDLVENYFPNNPNEITPYRYMIIPTDEVKKVVIERLKLLQNLKS